LFTTRPHPTPTLFPYTTLFRSAHVGRETIRKSLSQFYSILLNLYIRPFIVPASAVATRRQVVARETLPRKQCTQEHKYGFAVTRDRKSTRLNSSHVSISYAVFC